MTVRAQVKKEEGVIVLSGRFFHWKMSEKEACLLQEKLTQSIETLAAKGKN